MTALLKMPVMLIHVIFALLRFITGVLFLIIDHVTGILVGAILGLLKGSSGLLNLGLRSLGVSLIKRF